MMAPERAVQSPIVKRKSKDSSDDTNTSSPNPAKRQKNNTHQSSRRSFRCPLAAEYSCDKTYSRNYDAIQHGKTHKEKIKFACPLAKKFGCDRTYSRLNIAVQHAKIHTQRFACPLAKEFSCDRTYSTQPDATRHSRTHTVTILIPCPYADDFGCDKTFLRQDRAAQHGVTHKTFKFLCPFAKEVSCEKVYSRQSDAVIHGRSHTETFFCPLAKEFNCDKAFASPKQADVHGKIHTRIQRFPCPQADTFNCTKTFATTISAEQHLRSHLEDERLPCPLAEEFSCEETFSNKGNAQRHAVSHLEHTPFPCPLAEKFSCKERFVSKSNASRHAEGHVAHFIRTVPMCIQAVSKSPITRSSMALHMKKHNSRGDLEFLRTFPHPVEVEASTTSQDSETAKTVVNAEEEMAEEEMAEEEMAEEEMAEEEMAEEEMAEEEMAEEEMTEEEMAEEEMAEEEMAEGDGVEETGAVDQEGILQWLQEAENLQLSQINMSPEESREKIKVLNKKFKDQRPHLRVTSRNKGLCCLGPEKTSNGFVRKLCPRQAIIDIDTAYLFSKCNITRSNSHMAIHLEPRCVPCATEWRLTTKLQNFGLLAEETSEQGQCENSSCFKSRWFKSKYCEEHLINASFEHYHPTYHLDAAEVRRTLENVQWTYSPAFQMVRDRRAKIANGTMPGAMLVDLDLEFSPTSGKVFEIGLCEHISGQTLVDARVKHDCSDLELHRPDSLKGDSILRGISMKACLKVYGKDRSKCTNLLDVHDMANLFRARGITPQTCFLTWHQSKKDLTMLRDFFIEAGYDNILPSSNMNCIQMIPHFRRNLPRNVPLKLDIIFPLLFGNHELVGQNHRALPDALQLRLMVIVFEELCKPFNQRDLSLLPNTIRDWLLKAGSEKASNLTRHQQSARHRHDQRYLREKSLLMSANGSKSTEDTGGLAAHAEGKTPADSKQEQGLTQLKLDGWVGQSVSHRR